MDDDEFTLIHTILSLQTAQANWYMYMLNVLK